MDRSAPGLLLEFPLPRNWERAFGYQDDAHWLVAYWEPCGDEAVYSDGLVTATAEWSVLQTLQSRLSPGIIQWLTPSEFGEPASHVLLLDLKTRAIRITLQHAARRWLQNQWPEPSAVEVVVENWEELVERASREILARQKLLIGRALCPACGGIGWRSAPDGGYDCCPTCGGEHWVTAEAARRSGVSPILICGCSPQQPRPFCPQCDSNEWLVRLTEDVE